MAVAKKKAAVDAAPKAPRAKKVVAPVVPPPYVSPFVVGNRVTHTYFGGGQVAEVSSDKLSIQFDDNTTKVIVDTFVKLQKA